MSANQRSWIICCGKTGKCVVYGWTDAEPIVGSPITLHRARMVLYWDAACKGLFGLAQNGPRGDTQLTDTVEVTATEHVCQYLSVSQTAAKEIEAWP